jgi:hypothetical protein
MLLYEGTVLNFGAAEPVRKAETVGGASRKVGEKRVVDVCCLFFRIQTPLF